MKPSRALGIAIRIYVDFPYNAVEPDGNLTYQRQIGKLDTKHTGQTHILMLQQLTMHMPNFC